MWSLRVWSLFLFGAVLATPTEAAQSTAGGFVGLTTGRTVIVTDDAGTVTKGRLLYVTPDWLTIAVGGKDRRIERGEVRTVAERGDSVKNGMLIGLTTGAALGIVTGATATCGGIFEDIRECTAGEKTRIGAVAAGLLGAIGTGVGAGIDALISRQRLVYTRSGGAGPPAFAIVPSLSRSSAGFGVALAW